MQPELAPYPIIIVGAARSGTTYLTNLLNSHPDVCISNEIRLFVWAHKSLNELPQKRDVIYRERERFVRHLYESYPELIRSFYASYGGGKRYWGDKNPHYLIPDYPSCLETICRLFPRVHFIHIIRDGRDVVMSGLRGVWRDFTRVHLMWRSHIIRALALAQTLPAGQYFEVRYEELIRNDTAVARHIFDFLDIPFHLDVIQFCEAQQVQRTPFSSPTRNIKADVTVSDWATVLTPQQKLRSLDFLGPHLVQLGYESDASLAALRARISLELGAALPHDS